MKEGRKEGRKGSTDFNIQQFLLQAEQHEKEQQVVGAQSRTSQPVCVRVCVCDPLTPGALQVCAPA